MKGTIRVDFAGSRLEARDFARKHGPLFPQSLTLGRGPSGELTPNGDQTISAAWQSARERLEVQEGLARLGWPLEAQEERRWTSTMHPKLRKVWS